MRVSDGVQQLDTYTGKLSDACRPLAMAGIGIVWLIRVPNPPIPNLEWAPILAFPLALFVLALALDISQYVYYTLYWKYWHSEAIKRMQAANLPTDADPDYPRYKHLHFFGLFFFYGKGLATWVGMVFLVAWIASRMFF